MIDAFRYDMLRNSLPALRVVLGMISPEDGIKSCEEFNDEVRTYLVSAVEGKSAVVKQSKDG
ncbi:MAG: hypothetical protein NO130_05345 [Sulfolobales archaeon]|nr:hypothetical protein [Sulfolobales archaeon]